jgi:hypothetical protein
LTAELLAEEPLAAEFLAVALLALELVVVELLAVELLAAEVLAAAVLAAEVLDAAVFAVLAAAALPVLLVDPVPFDASVPFDDSLLFDDSRPFDLSALLGDRLGELALLADALVTRDLVDLASPSLAPRLALEAALRLFAVFLLEGIRGYSLSLSRCGDGTGSHMTGGDTAHRPG